MPVDRYARHRAVTATPESRRADLHAARGLCFFFGLLALAQAVFAPSWPAAVLLLPCVLLEFANRAPDAPRAEWRFTLAAAFAGLAEATVFFSIFIDRVPRLGTLLLGALVAWSVFRSGRIYRELHAPTSIPPPEPAGVLASAMAGVGAGRGDEKNHVSPVDFETKIGAGLALLNRPGPLSADDAIMVVRLSNTLRVTKGKRTEPQAAFENRMWDEALPDRLALALGESIPNHGAGLYFTAHDLHWGGAPGNIRNRDRYTIAEPIKKDLAP